MISNSGGDERGNIYGGKAGDNTGGEWNIIPWYSRPWYCVLRHPDEKVRNKIAELARKSANNNHIGYDQYQRNTFWEQLKKANYNPEKITTDCEADCSAGVIAITKAVGNLLDINKLKNISCTYTGNMRVAYENAGFDVLTNLKYLTSDDYLLPGDILLNDDFHVATNLTQGSKIKTKLKTIRNAGGYATNETDPIGKSVIKKITIPKGATVELLDDDGSGWLKVKYKNTTLWVVNTAFKSSNTSKYVTETIKKGSRVRRLNTSKTKFETDTKIKTAHKFVIICIITSGKYKGCKYAKLISNDKHNGRYYYIF